MDEEQDQIRTPEPGGTRSPALLGWVGVTVGVVILLLSVVGWTRGEVLEAALADIFALLIGTLGVIVLRYHRIGR